MASNSSFGKETGALEVAHNYASQVVGKIVLITGVSKGGIGEATARAFAYAGASQIIVTGRDDNRLSSITKALAAEYPSSKFRPHKLDLKSLEAVHRSAQEILDDTSIPRIDILIANAGGNFLNVEKELTADGLETHFGVNHIGHFLFITSLLPKLLAAAKTSKPGDTRVVMISSMAMMGSPIRFADYNFDGKPVADDEQPSWQGLKDMLGVEPCEGYNVHVAYGQSKTANTLFAVYFSRLFSEKGIYSFSLHPGGVRSRGALTFLNDAGKERRDALDGLFDKNTDQGAATTMVAALDPQLTPQKGVYLSDCQVADAPPYAVNEEKAEKLWKLSEDIVREKVKI